MYLGGILRFGMYAAVDNRARVDRETIGENVMGERALRSRTLTSSKAVGPEDPSQRTRFVPLASFARHAVNSRTIQLHSNHHHPFFVAMSFPQPVPPSWKVNIQS